MQYDPIKRRLGNFFNRTPLLRKLFYSLLDLLLLRAWHIRKALNSMEYLHKKQVNILDAGSGFGQYSYRMSRLFPNSDILGVDLKEEQVADCNSFFRKTGTANRVRFETADLTKFVRPSRYDLILSVDVMEHIEEDELVFKNFCQSLVEGGVLLISTPSDQGGSDSHDHHEEGAHGFIDEHVRDGYNALDIMEKLYKAGFTKVYTSYSYGEAGSLSWKLSMKYPIQMLGLSRFFFVLLPFYYLITFPFCALCNYMDVTMQNASGTGLIVKAVK